MNERIYDLAEQAEIGANELIDKDGKHPSQYPRYFAEKFAELIVRECADIANKQFTAATGLDDRDSWTAAEIKKHFGVE